MTIWIFAVVLLGLSALVGYATGAIRSCISFVGLLLGFFLAKPLAPLLQPLFPMMGLTNVVWLWILPPLAVVVLVGLLFTIAAFVVHWRVGLYFKYKTEDFQRHAWERFNSRLGVCIGLVTALCVMLVLGAYLYVYGYVTVQFAADDYDPAYLRFWNQARSDMRDAGLDRFYAGYDRTSKKFYEATDILGLIYRNPQLDARMATYPPFITLSERSEFQEIVKDKEYRDLLSKKSSLVDIINSPKTQTILQNQDLQNELLQLDLKDVRKYLETGASKFDPLKILGRWELDANQVIITLKKKHPDVSATELVAWRQVLAPMLNGVMFTATPDNKVVLKGAVADLSKLTPPKPSAARPRPRPQANATTAPAEPVRPALDPVMAARYRIGSRRGPAPPSSRAAAPAPAPAAPAGVNAPNPEPPPVVLEAKTFQGTWDGENESYRVKLQDDKGKTMEFDAVVEADELVLTPFGDRLVFLRQG